MVESQEELAQIMAEPPGGENFGSRRNGNGSESLNVQDWITEGYLAQGGWRTERGKPGLPHGRPKTIEKEWLTRDAIAAVEQRLGFTREEFHRVVRQGRLSAEDRKLREEIASKLAHCVRAGAVVSALAEVLGCSQRTLWRLVRN